MSKDEQINKLIEQYNTVVEENLILETIILMREDNND